MTTRIRLRADDTGAIEARRIPPNDAFVALTEIQSNAGATAPLVPKPLEDEFQQLVAAVGVVHGRLQAVLPPSAKTTEEAEEPPELPDELLALATREVLTTPALLNNFIDAVVGGLEQTFRGAAAGFADDPKTAAGRLLLETIFQDGKVFLQYRNKRQWSAVHNRFATLSDKQSAAVVTLEVADRVAKLNLLNDHFGDILGITASEPPPPDDEPEDTLDDVMHHVHVLARRLLGFANAAWPEETPEAARARKQLLGPYLEPVVTAIEEASQRAKEAMASQETQRDEGEGS